MKKRHYILIVLISSIIFISGCAQLNYVCYDGTVVSTHSLCPKETEINFELANQKFGHYNNESRDYWAADVTCDTEF